MADPTKGAVSLDDSLFTPWLGEYTPAPDWETARNDQFYNPLAVAGNAAGDVNDAIQGFGAAEGLGMARTLEMFPNTAQMAYTGGSILDNLFPRPQNSFMQNDASSAFHQMLQSLGKSPAVAQDKALPFLRQGDPQAMLDALRSGLIEDPLNTYVRPALRGDARSLGLHALRHPLNTALDLQAAQGLTRAGYGALRKLPGMARALTPAEQAVARLAEKPQAAANALKGKVGKYVESKLPQLEADRVMKDLKGPLPLVLQRKFKAMRRELESAWNRIPAELHDKVMAAAEQTDPRYEHLTEHPAVKNFLDVADKYENEVASKAMEHGIMSREDLMVTRHGPAYMSSVRSGRFRPPLIDGQPMKNLTSGDLYRPEVQSEIDQFAQQRAANMQPESRYMPVIQKGSVEKYFRQPLERPIGETSIKGTNQEEAFSRREKAAIKFNQNLPVGIRGEEHSFDAAKTLAMRIEQAHRAFAIYDWMAQVEATTGGAKTVLFNRINSIIAGTLQEAGFNSGQIKVAIERLESIGAHLEAGELSKPAQVLEKLIDWDQTFNHELENSPLLKPYHKLAKFQKMATIKFDLFYPAYIVSQTGAFFGLTKLLEGNPRKFINAVAAMVLARNEKLAARVVPKQWLEHIPKIEAKHPLVRAWARYQQSAKHGVNYFRTAHGMAVMLDEFDAMSPTEQKFVLHGVVRQLKLENRMSALMRMERALDRGGFAKVAYSDVKPIVERKLKGGRRKRYLNQQIKKFQALNPKTEAKLKELRAALSESEPTWFHGGAPGIRQFDAAKNSRGMYGKGTYFTSNKGVAAKYAGATGKVYGANLSTKNVLDVNGKVPSHQLQALQEIVNDRAPGLKLTGEKGKFLYGELKEHFGVDRAQDVLKSAGIDGISFVDQGHPEIVAFHNEHVHMSRGGTSPEAAKVIQKHIVQRERVLEQRKKFLQTAPAELQQLTDELDKLSTHNKQVYRDIYNEQGKRLRTKQYVSVKRMGNMGRSEPEWNALSHEFQETIHDVYGRYHQQLSGKTKFLDSTFLWINMMNHARTLGGFLYLKKPAVLDAIIHIDHRVEQLQKSYAESQNMPPWWREAGAWQSDRYSPPGTKQIWMRKGWNLLHESLMVPQLALHLLNPQLPGIEEPDFDLNGFLKGGLLFMGWMPGTDRKVMNSEHFRLQDREFDLNYEAEKLKHGQKLDAFADRVKIPYDNVLEQLFVSAAMGFNQKLWAFLRDAPARVQGKVPSDLTLPIVGGHFKKDHKTGKYEERAPESPLSMFPGGKRFAPVQIRENPLERKYEAIDNRRLTKETMRHIKQGLAEKE